MDDIPDRLRGLFQAIFAHIQSELRGRVSLDDLRKSVNEAFLEMHLDPEPASWETARRVDAARARSRDWVHRSVIVAGHITELRDVQLVTVPTDEDFERVDSTCAKVTDFEGETLSTISITQRTLIDELRRHHRSGRGVEVLGIIVTLPVKYDPKRADHLTSPMQRAFHLHVVDVRACESSLDIVMATDDERQAALALLADLREQGISPLRYIHDEVVSHLQIVGLEDFHLLDDLIVFVIMQVVSMGRFGNASGRLHLLIVGPPGQGKKILTEVARVLAVRFEMISSGSLSVPGLVGACSRSQDGWHAERGVLVRAAHGIASLQDAHGLNVSELRRIGPVLQQVMEDGRATTSKAGGETWDTPVSLVIDLNRTAHLGVGTGGREAPLATLRPVLSRLDLIVEIPADIERASRIASRMMQTIAQQGPAANFGWQRWLRVLVAALRDAYPVIDLDPVRDVMVRRLDDVLAVNASGMKRRQDGTDLPLRATVSMARMVAASARAEGRGWGEGSDVERAVHYLNYKLRYLDHVPVSTNYQTTKSEPREEWFRSRYAGKTVRPEEAAAEYEADLGEAMGERTARRYLKRIGGRKDGTEWTVPAGVDPQGSAGDDDHNGVSDCPTVHEATDDAGPAAADVSDCPIVRPGETANVSVPPPVQPGTKYEPQPSPVLRVPASVKTRGKPMKRIGQSDSRTRKCGRVAPKSNVAVAGKLPRQVSSTPPKAARIISSKTPPLLPRQASQADTGEVSSRYEGRSVYEIVTMLDCEDEQ